MKEMAQEVLEYFRENLVAALVIALFAGFAASKTVAHGEKGNFVLYLIVGLLGSFLGQYAMLYFGLKETMEELAAFRLFFDFLAAYIGSFILAALIHFIKPN